MATSRAPYLFAQCDQAIRMGVPIVRASTRDKEFAAQDWLRDRLGEAGLEHSESGRNTYPDFPLLGDPPEGFEVKSLAWPGRNASYDANSQPPSGVHGGRTIFYVFIRYPKGAGSTFPVYDLVICHGDLLNPTRDYVHRNENVPNFGAYGDIMIRDRKMYVVRTPYSIAEGLAGQRTLILPSAWNAPSELQEVGRLERPEAAEVAVAYRFDLKRAALETISEPNANAGRPHKFTAYRVEGGDGVPVNIAPAGAPRRKPR